MGARLLRGGNVFRTARSAAPYVPAAAAAAHLMYSAGTKRSRADVLDDFSLPSTMKRRKVPRKGFPMTAGRPYRRPMKKKRMYKRKLYRKKKQKGPSKYIKIKKDTALQASFNNPKCGWIGCQANGGYTNFVESFCAAVCRALLARGGCQVKSFDDIIGGGRINGSAATNAHELTLTFKKVNTESGAIEYTNVANAILHNSSFADVLNLIRPDVQAKLYDGQSLDSATLKNTVTGAFVYQDIELNASTIEMYVTTVLHVQNQTLADSNGANEDVANALNIHAQPIQGKVYKFKHASAIIRPEVGLTTNPFQDEVQTSGLSLNTFAEDVLQHPPRGKSVFENCVSESPIKFAPGQSIKHVMVLRYKGSIGKFCDLIMRRSNVSGNPQRAWGATDLLCVERVVRSGNVAVEVAINAERHFSSHCQLKTMRSAIIEYERNVTV